MARESRATERVAMLLATTPGATIAELARRSGLGNSTVGKALAGLEAAGAAVRQPGGHQGGRRQADRWSSHNGSATKGHTRMGRGDLRALVLDQLRAAVEPVGASALATATGHSAGAVGNCLERLVELGLATKISDHPRRYQSA